MNPSILSDLPFLLNKLRHHPVLTLNLTILLVTLYNNRGEVLPSDVLRRSGEFDSKQGNKLLRDLYTFDLIELIKTEPNGMRHYRILPKGIAEVERLLS